MSKKTFKKILIMLLVISLIFPMLTSCQPEEKANIEILGTWLDDWSKVVVTNTEFDFYYPVDATETSYEYEITSYDNEKFNAGESGEGDCGHIVIKYTKAPSWNPGVEGKFTVLRWKNLNTSDTNTTMDYSEGYCGTYYDSEDEAKTQVTEANGCFGTYTEREKQ